jgi:predicted RecB family nuclease
MNTAHRLTKSLFAAGLQCHKLLWLRVHEPMAVELQPDIVLQDRFDQGRQVGELARTRFEGGALATMAGERSARLEGTAFLMAAHPGPWFEAAFSADEVFVAADIVLRVDDGFCIVEVKSASEKKDEHIPDAAIQTHVLRRNGIRVDRVEVMHLCKEFRHPDGGELFTRSDVTAEVEAMLPAIGAQIDDQRAVLDGPMPAAVIGARCFAPRDCPFLERCWPSDPGHISKLYNVGPKKTVAYMQKGVHRISDLPGDAKLPPAAARQRRALETGNLVVEPGLASALEPFDVHPLGFLDFETVARAVPVWPGMGPWHQAAAQFSYHETVPGGGYRHEQHLADGGDDARPGVARRLIDATRNARRVVMYSHFEKTQIGALAEAVPALAPELLALRDKLIDLLPVVREHVYHPGFQGSFSIKYVLGPLVPGLDYSDLVIVNGLVASVQIARLLFVADRIAPDERPNVRRQLLEYCERDTWATVRLLESLRALADRPASGALRSIS